MSSIIPKRLGDLDHMRMCELLDRIVLEHRRRKLIPSLVVNPVTRTFYGPELAAIAVPGLFVN